jgi:MFS family permease
MRFLSPKRRYLQRLLQSSSLQSASSLGIQTQIIFKELEMIEMSRTKSLLGLPDANDKVERMARILFMLGPFANVAFVISTTFYLIFIAEALGQGDYFQGLPLVGVLVSLQMATQLGLDYPTGAIGDWLGQRWIMASSSFTFAVTFFMVSLVTSATPIWIMVVIYVLQGFALSQQSGAFQAWFDNNYRVAMPGDTDRKQYGVFWGRVGMVMSVVSTAALIPGSLLAVVFGRPWVFQIQAILFVIVGFLSLGLITDFPEVVEARTERPSMNEYISILKDGISYLFKHDYIKFIVLGTTLAASAVTVWGNLILFPMYFSYLITDVAVASFRTILFFPGIFYAERSGVWSQKYDPKKWLPRFRFLQTCGFVFFTVFAIIMFIFPPVTSSTNIINVVLPFTDVVIMMIPQESLLPIFIIFFSFIFTGIFGAMAQIMTQRVLLDVIPNRIRNSVYSLTPTIVTLFSLPQVIIFGTLLPLVDFPITLLLVGLVSLMGVGLIRRGFGSPKPAKVDDIAPVVSEEAEVSKPAIDALDEEIEEDVT